MITLATLERATEQEIFDQVINHFYAQGCRSAGAIACRYRLQEGERTLKCAAGCLIADDEYLPSMETESWGSLAKNQKMPVSYVHVHFITKLQVIHDSATCFEEMMGCYVAYAVERNLIFPKGGKA